MADSETKAIDEIVRLQIEARQLKADLAKYGGHMDECKVGQLRELAGISERHECNCGWAEVEKGVSDGRLVDL